jgi:undecaprenyl-diphosphatase
VSPSAFQKGNLPFISEDISKSCPSGHETMAAVGFLSLIFLPFTVTSLNTTKTRASLFTIAILGTVIVGIGRMMAGAHYLSDVTLGIVIALGTLTLFYLQTRYSAKYLNT